MMGIPKIKPTQGQVFVITAFFVVFFFFFTRPAPTPSTPEGERTGPHEVMT